MTEQRERAHPRYAVELDTELATADGIVTGRTHDISRGGFCFYTERGLPIGSAGNVRLALVFGEGQVSEHLTVPCEVIWSSRVSGFFQIGCRFGELDDEAKSYLDLFIRYLTPDDDEDDTLQ